MRKGIMQKSNIIKEKTYQFVLDIIIIYIDAWKESRKLVKLVYGAINASERFRNPQTRGNLRSPILHV